MVSFPPEPFYFVDLAHMDGVLRAWNKVGHKTLKGLSGVLKADKTFKAASKTYGQLKLAGYRHSVPVHESLKEPRWSAYREGWWGKRPNPPAPDGNVRPGAAANVPIGERLVGPAASVPSDDESSSNSGSISQPSSASSESSPGPRQRVRRLTRSVISSDPEEISDNTSEGVTLIAAPEFPALHISSTASLTQAVTTSVFHRSQVETNGAATSGTSPIIVQTCMARDRLSREQQGIISPDTDSGRTAARNPDDLPTSSRPTTPAESSRVNWTPMGSEFDWAPVETDSWEKFEEAAQQNAQGAAEKVLDYAVDVMGLLRMKINTQGEQQTETLRAARHSEEFRQPGQVENLMGRARYLWDGNAKLKKKIASLEIERQELASQQTQTTGEMQRLHNRIGELQGEGERLQRQLEEVRAPPPPAKPDVLGAASDDSTDPESIVSQLRQDCNRIRGNGMPYITKCSNYRPPMQSWAGTWNRLILPLTCA